MESQARLVRLVCCAPPEGYAAVVAAVLEKQVMPIGDIPDGDHSTSGRVLKK